jgi:hypothetical protein
MDFSALVAEASGEAVPIQSVKSEDLDRAVAGLDERARRFVLAQGFKAEAGRHLVIPDSEGNLGRVLFGSAAPTRPIEARSSSASSRRLSRAVFFGWRKASRSPSSPRSPSPSPATASTATASPGRTARGSSCREASTALRSAASAMRSF